MPVIALTSNLKPRRGIARGNDLVAAAVANPRPKLPNKHLWEKMKASPKPQLKKYRHAQ